MCSITVDLEETHLKIAKGKQRVEMLVKAQFKSGEKKKRF
jgi:hypothetical protein